MMEPGSLRRFLEAVPAELLDPGRLGRGAGVTVAIVDSGVDGSHPALVAPVTRSVEVRPAPGGAWRVIEAPPVDPAGHGTACADIIGRLAPEAQLWNVRVFGEGARGDSRALLAGLRWVIEQGAHVINLSLGTRDPAMAEPLRALVDEAYRRCLMVVAAANNIPGVASYPAMFTSLVCVDAAYLPSPEDFRFRFGALSELEAPGVYVEAAWPGGGRRLFTGTSFACPHVSGHIARIVSANPGIMPFQVKTVLYAMGSRNEERARLAAGNAPKVAS